MDDEMMKGFIEKLFRKSIVINSRGIFISFWTLPIKRISVEEFEKMLVEEDDLIIHYFDY